MTTETNLDFGKHSNKTTTKTLIALAAALALLTTAAHAFIITTNTALAPGDTNCNSQDIVANH